MPRELRPRQWPHFMEKKHRRDTYHSEKILGQLYDIAQLVKFIPNYDIPFDRRIIDAYDLDPDVIQQATDLKDEYDTRIKRIMAQHDVETEFEVWSSFVMSHNQEKSDYSFTEELGKIMLAVKDHFRKLCREKVDGLDQEALFRLVAAMYTVTAREVTAAVDQCKQTKVIAGEEVPLRRMCPQVMPLVSFPWIFDRELRKIASGTFSARENVKARQEVQSQNKPRIKCELQGEAEKNVLRVEDYGVKEIQIDLDDNRSTPLDLLAQLVGTDDSPDSESESDEK
jgi:RNA-dependent RNA polymerase